MDLVFIAALIIALDLAVLWFVLRGAPFIPTKREGLERVMKLAQVRPGAKALDIGSGDGRIVIALARAGAEAHGVENNPLLVWWSRRKIRQAGLEGRAFIHRADLWGFDCSGFDTITLFGITHIMRRLGKKLRRELKPGARIVSMAFEFPDWPEVGHDGLVFAYDIR
jgi:cyclopropane fatty-acyl-phospholipid synthase-like methyltransferase